MIPIDSASLRLWESIAEWGFIFVLIGVVGEGLEIGCKILFQSLYRKQERRFDIIGGVFWLVLALGLGVELLGSHKARLIADRVNSRLNKEAGDTRQIASTTESNNLELAKQLSATQKELIEAKAELGDLGESVTDLTEPMIIRDAKAFGMALTNCAGTHVIIGSIDEPNAQTTMLNLADGFRFAGWNVEAGRGFMGALQGVLVGCNTAAQGPTLDRGNPDLRAARSLIVLLNKCGVPARQDWPRFTLGRPPSNTVFVVIGRRLPGKFIHFWQLLAKDDELDMQMEAIGEKITVLSHEKSPSPTQIIEERDLMGVQINLFDEWQRNRNEMQSLVQQIAPNPSH